MPVRTGLRARPAAEARPLPSRPAPRRGGVQADGGQAHGGDSSRLPAPRPPSCAAPPPRPDTARALERRGQGLVDVAAREQVRRRRGEDGREGDACGIGHRAKCRSVQVEDLDGVGAEHQAGIGRRDCGGA
jgi:hypothetical protein